MPLSVRYKLRKHPENTARTFPADPHGSICPARAFRSPPREDRHSESGALGTDSNPKHPLSEMKCLVSLLHDCKNDIPGWFFVVGFFLAACLVLLHIWLLHRASSCHAHQPQFWGETQQTGAGKAEGAEIALGSPAEAAAKLLCTEICRFDAQRGEHINYFWTKSFFSSRRRNYARQEVSSRLNIYSHIYTRRSIKNYSLQKHILTFAPEKRAQQQAALLKARRIKYCFKFFPLLRAP